MAKTRREHDALGFLDIPASVPRGIYTERVLEQYPQQGIAPVPEVFLRTYIKTKIAYARLNAKHGKISKKERKAIVDTARRLLRLTSESFMEYFPIGQIQSGGGTSTNMMVNEVLANLATKELGGKFGDYLITPHNHINASQSSNDTFPGVTKITCIELLSKLQKELRLLHAMLKRKAEKHSDLKKVGRTHLQDAVIITLGDEFGAYARTIEKNARYIKRAIQTLQEVNFGGTATGSKQNITAKMRRDIIKRISKEFRMKLKNPGDYFEQNSSSGDIAYAADSLSHLSSDLIKICNDLRLLTSGPLAGINEISLPEVQPGSSIMPGKVNPSIPEALTMISAKVIGNVETVHIITRQAQLELQQFVPGIAWACIESTEELVAGLKMFRLNCVRGIKANKKRIKELLDGSFAYATDYSEQLGYETVAKLVHKAFKTGQPLRELLDKKVEIEERKAKKVSKKKKK